MPRVKSKIKHFILTTATAVDPARWFLLARGLDDVLWEAGYELDMFYDCCDTDRQWILEQDSVNFFEGLVESAADIDQDEVTGLMQDYLASHEIIMEACEFDDETEIEEDNHYGTITP